MALDRFVYWKDKRPTGDDELVRIVEDFFNGAAVIQARTGWIIINLPGEPMHPLRRVDGLVPALREFVEGFGKNQRHRWIEICLSEAGIDIITRSQDEYTNGLAVALMKLFARWYQAEIENGGHVE